MNCHDARERLSELIDDALDPATRAAVDAHVSGCPECRREIDRLERTVALLQAVEPVRAPVGFVDRVVEAARPVPWYRRVGGRLARLQPLGVPIEAVALVLVATLAVFVFERTPALQQAARVETTLLSTERAGPAPTVSARRDPLWAAGGADPARSTAPPEALVRGTESLRTGELAAVSERSATPSPAQKPAASVTAPPPTAGARETIARPPTASDSAALSRQEAAPTTSRPGLVPPGDPASRPEVSAAAPPPVLSEGVLKVFPSSGAATSATLGPAERRDASHFSDAQARPDEQEKSGDHAGAQAKSSERARSAEPSGPGGPATSLPATSLDEASRPQAVIPLRVPLAATPRVFPRVAGRLAVADREAADRELAALVSGVGGAETARRTEGPVAVVEVMVPGQRYAAFASGLARIGTWTADGQPSDLSAAVTVTLRITR